MPSAIELSFPLTLPSSDPLENNDTMISHHHHDSASQSPASTSPDAQNAGNNNGNKKRNSQSAGVDANGNPKPVKRRAAKACAACRARKVRCDVMQRYHVTAEGEVTCSNCTMDGIKCVIEESKRRKKHLPPADSNNENSTSSTTVNVQNQNWGDGIVNPSDITNPDVRRWSGSNVSNEVADELRATGSGQLPFPNVTKADVLRRQSFIGSPFAADAAYSLLTSASMHGDLTATSVRATSPPPNAPLLKHQLPAYLKPLPPRMTSVDIDYLFAKGALSLPQPSVRNALLRSYIEYVHPYMPLVEVHELLDILNDGTGDSGRVSLLLFQSIMFAGTAFVDMEILRVAGYSNRKAARKAFFQKARVLYDFDYEVDRVSLVQSLLLMTYWYETPDDQKDTWHWMGVAISLAHTIGLHRNPANSSMSPSKKKLWKRIWWACFMRDRLVALGMRRPTRVKEEDYDVPMLVEDDFEIQALSDSNTIIGPECKLIRDVGMQRELAQMCIAKAKLCLCISHVLAAQYSVLVKHQGMQGQEGSTRSSVMLFPKKLDQTDEVQRCDVELTEWIKELPAACTYNPHSESGPVFVQRALLHMIYYTTLSALHRPQVLPSASTNTSPTATLHDISRQKVREASRQITNISSDLHTRNLERYLPTTGVTVLLPAIIIHLLDIKSASEEERRTAMEGFKRCMIVLEGLRGNYSSADFATQFLEAAVRKAGIEIGSLAGNASSHHHHHQVRTKSDLDLRMSSLAMGMGMGVGMGLSRATTPPLSEGVDDNDEGRAYMHERGHIPATSSLDAISSSTHHHPALSALSINVHTPPENDSHHTHSMHHHSAHDALFSPSATGLDIQPPAQPEFDYSTLNLSDFVNLDFNAGAGDMWTVPLEEGAHGESGGFMGDMGWVNVEGWSRVGSPVPMTEVDIGA